MESDNGSGNWLDDPSVLAVIFHPRPESGLAAEQNGFERLKIPVAGDVSLGARFYATGKDAPTILFFHGNGEIVADYHDIAEQYARIKVNFLPVGYRGYGRSTGQPTVSTLLQDARVAFDFARGWLEKNGYGGRLFVMGRSLGSASALEIAAARPEETAGLIIESGFSDAVALLVRLGARVPSRSRDSTFLQTDKIRAYTGPTLIIHGKSDFIIPVSDGDALYKASASSRKQILKIPYAGHNNVLSIGMREYMSAIKELVHGG